MKTTNYLVALTVGLALLSGASAMAKREGRGDGSRMADELNLTKEQKEKFKEMRKKTREQHQARREAMEAAREEMEEAMKGDASEKDLRAKFEKLEKLQAEFARERFDHILAIRAMLTPEQRAKFRGMRGPGRGGDGPRGKMGHGKWDRDDEE